MKALVAVLVVLIIAFLGAGGYLLYDQLNQPGKAELVDAPAEEESAPGSTVTASGKPGVAKMLPPQNDADIPGKLDYAYMRNDDVVGWLKVPNTDINHALMQGDDNRYYERRNEDGQEDVYGCYFLDYECMLGIDAQSQNTVIYGHSDLKDNPDGKRFSQLFRFTDDAFAAKTPYIYLFLPEGKLCWQIFAAGYTDTSFDYIRVHMSDAEKLELAKKAQALSVRDYGVTLTADDRLLTLSTCSIKYGTDGSKRFIVMARLVTEEEALKGEAAAAAALEEAEPAAPDANTSGASEEEEETVMVAEED